MPPTLPEWLDKPFLEAALQGGEEKEPRVTVEDFSAVLAVAAGNNYTSQIFRVQLTYRTSGSGERSTTLIVKAPHAQFQNMNKEPFMYNRVLPTMEEKIKHNFAPTSYFSTQKNVLIFQDLKETGYVMCDKFKQLDYSHCELVFKTMAKFHAASVALHKENPTEIEQLGLEPLFSDESIFAQMMKPLVGPSLRIITDALNKTEDSELALQFLLSRKENEKFFESLKAICKPKKKGLNVMNHGDLWINNVLFKHSESGEVEDVKFIDYQALRYMTPAIDILYFTWTSADEDVRENRLHQLYDVYLQTLNDSLERLGCEERYTREELWGDMKSSVDFALAVTLLNLPMMLAEPEEAVDLSAFDLNEFINNANNGVIEPGILRAFNGKHFTAKVPTIIKEIYKNLQ